MTVAVIAFTRRGAALGKTLAAALGGTVLSLVGSEQSSMMTVAGVLLIVGALSVTIIKETIGGKK